MAVVRRERKFAQLHGRQLLLQHATRREILCNISADKKCTGRQLKSQIAAREVRATDDDDDDDGLRLAARGDPLWRHLDDEVDDTYFC